MNSKKTYSYQVAKDALSETDKNRILCVYLNGEMTNVDWDKATKEFGSVSAESMRVSIRNAFKKIEKASSNDNETVTPPKTPSDKKRKAVTPTTGQDEDDKEETPKPTTRRGRKAAKKMETDEEADSKLNDDLKVKDEDEDEYKFV